MDQALKTRIINFRRELHQHPETSFREFETHQRIKNILLQFGVPKENITEISREGQQPTGLIVDLYGKAEPQGQNFCVAFRADIDALQMEELNNDLPYLSKNKGAAHMCGHDGHTACLVGFVPLFLSQSVAVPKNKKVRLLFQPSEEGPLSGAQLMIEKGCLEEVNEVYGFHNWPVGHFGDIWCKQGPVMSQSVMVKISIIGEGGHGSAPENLKVAIWQAVDFYTKMQSYVKLLQQEKRTFVATFPVFHSGQRFNVIHEKAEIAGTLRVYDAQTRELLISKIKQLLGASEAKGFKTDLNLSMYPLTCNSKKEADNVTRVAKEYLGEDKVHEGTLPFRASQDFGYYTYERPGAYFFFCTKLKEDQVFLHNARFNFKDELIERASVFWLKLAQDRLRSC